LKIKSTGILLACLFAAGCVTNSEPGVPTAASDTSLPTFNDGLVPLSAAEIEATFSGKLFEDVSGGWTWSFGENGLAESRAKDGSWGHTDQKWSVEGDKLCRSIKAEYPCVNIYKVGSSILFGKADSSELETWAITAK